MSQRSKWCLIGIPDHQGVINVGGRIGAAGGPEAFRRALYRLKGKGGVLESMDDVGDLQGVTQDIDQNHLNAAQLISTAHQEHSLSVVIGGGHDHGYSHLLGISQGLPSKSRRLGCINIDAHFDVRKPDPVANSGSPFYLAIESGILNPQRFVEFGIQSHCNTPERWSYASSKKLTVVPFEKLRHGQAAKAFHAAIKKLKSRSDIIVVSFDLDAVASAYAPGVSAPQAEGFDSTDILEMMELAGAEKRVVSLGIFELNPVHDVGGLTARLAATAAYHFISRALLR